MRIAQIAPIIESLPPKKYGGTERVIYALTEELVKRGHVVTLFASGDSQTSAELVSVFPKALRKTTGENIYGNNIWSLRNVRLAYQMQNQFDIIHDHTYYISLPLANNAQVPVVITLHGPITKEDKQAFEIHNKPYVISISHKQSEIAPDLNYIGNVYHGLPMQSYPYSETDEGYLLFVGRIHVEKGVEEKGMHHAIDIAEKTNLPLLIAAKLDKSLPEDVAYFQQKIKPRLTDKIRWIGEVDEQKRNLLMSKAICLLHTINFPEPFGLTLIEAMACGCPVIAFDMGSIPEIIINGKTGFVVQNSDEAIHALNKITKINRYYCRNYTLTRFSVSRMTDEYETIYKAILQEHKSRTDKSISHTFFKQSSITKEEP
ncbi:MAG TPA: glycosyltransferase family 4 protein [Candidatus Saccharimonadales bacterium]|nr:glycosyltransferase family 4 protein [Candidatus Saccharimonadales bacterium]